MSGVAFTPLGGCLSVLQRGQGGLLCPMLATMAPVGQENPCRVGPAYLCLRQVLRPGQGHQLAMVGMGGPWAGLWVAVSPHKGHKPASSQLQGNQKGHKGHKPAAGKPQAGPRETLASWWELVGPWACCRRKPGPSPGKCKGIIRIPTTSLGR